MKQYIYIVSFLFILITIGLKPTHAQVPKATAKLDSNKILIGDHAHLTIQLTAPKTHKIIWTSVRDTIIKEIEIVELSKIDTIPAENKDMIGLRQTLTITSFDSGFYAIPPFQFIITHSNDTTITETQALLFEVQTIQIDTTKAIKDIKSPLKAPITFREILPYLIGGVVLTALILLTIYYIRKRKKAEPLIKLPKKPKLPPHEIALQSLEELRKKKLWQSGNIKEYHTELTEIIRTYIDDRFCIHAMEMTSEDILESFNKIDINKDAKDKLKQLFVLADLVKFAKEKPLPSEHDLSLNYAIDYVKDTIIVIQEAMKEGNNSSQQLNNNTSVSNV